MRLGQIGCGRQNPPIQSAEPPSRIRMTEGMPSTSLQDWKVVTALLLPQKRRWYDAGFPYRSACTNQPRQVMKYTYRSLTCLCALYFNSEENTFKRKIHGLNLVQMLKLIMF
ncbi:Hypothetical_protein [Hexamita inflata]|uniref:Hypothetical_protein n=1 Tax=Hexamita inflata TaxID=28002 RepID=A0ABP1KD34_9EUKA